jgi:hypothetical protein
LGVLLAAGCDPNVVIGAKFRLLDDTGGVAAVGGSAAVAGSGAQPPSDPGSGGAVGGEAGAPSDAGLYFEARHEDGSLSEWDDGADQDAGGYYADAAPPKFSIDQAHSGSGSAKVSIDTSSGTAPIARLYRRIERDHAYYSAWFYLAEDHTPSVWWSIFLFRAGQDRNKSIDLWDIDLVRVDGDQLSLSIYDHQRDKTIAIPSQPIIPIAKWFRIEAYLAFVKGQPTELEYWLDGAPLISLSDLSEAPAGQPMYWLVGNGGSLLTPPVSTVYIDDATISATRLAP